MKRDMDLVRDILLTIEEQDDGSVRNRKVNFDQTDSVVLTEHLFLLAEAGFIEGSPWKGINDRSYHVNRLTWTGHEFLDTIRDPNIWAQTKNGAKKVGSFSLEVLREIAKGIVKKKVADLSGVELDL